MYNVSKNLLLLIIACLLIFVIEIIVECAGYPQLSCMSFIFSGAVVVNYCSWYPRIFHMHYKYDTPMYTHNEEEYIDLTLHICVSIILMAIASFIFSCILPMISDIFPSGMLFFLAVYSIPGEIVGISVYLLIFHYMRLKASCEEKDNHILSEGLGIFEQEA